MPDEMMNCQEVMEKLADFVDRELDSAEREQVDAHLKMCPECLHAVRWEDKVLRKVTSCCKTVEEPTDLFERIHRTIQLSDD